MTERDHIQVREEQANRYASREDFHTIFSEHLTELYQLSFLLTRDPARAERCLVSGLEDCVTGNRAFREWVCSWAKRTIVQNAIRELKPRPIHSNSPLSETILPDIGQLSIDPGGHFAIDAVLGLEDFERFVFVLSVLEHYSEHDCGLLLGCSAREVREARSRALEELMDSSQRDLLQNQPFMREKNENDSFRALSSDQIAFAPRSWPLRQCTASACQVCLQTKRQTGAGGEVPM
jgi:DNA-directed RNA polymerase specialized sigma24 family protein